MITTGTYRDERGQALVEFALVLPIVLLLLFGILQVALVLDARQTVAYAARVAADTYARTLDPASADAAAAEAGSQLRPQLRPPVASVIYAVTQEETQTCVQTQRRFFRSRCLQYAQTRTTSDRPATQGAPGKRGDLVVARVTYRYPSPIRAAFGPFRFPAEFPMTEEGVARIEVDSPVAGSAAPRTAPVLTPTATPVAVPTPPSTATPSPTAATLARCYRVETTQDVWASYMPYTPQFLVSGSPAKTVRLVPGSTAKVTLRLDPKPKVAPGPLPGHYYGVTLDPVPATPVVDETITITDAGFAKTYSGGSLRWAFKEGAFQTFNYWARLNVTPLGGGC